MVVYNFKKMTTVPTATDFLDIVLSQTQRKTPTVVHPGYNIVCASGSFTCARSSTCRTPATRS